MSLRKASFYPYDAHCVCTTGHANKTVEQKQGINLLRSPSLQQITQEVE